MYTLRLVPSAVYNKYGVLELACCRMDSRVAVKRTLMSHLGPLPPPPIRPENAAIGRRLPLSGHTRCRFPCCPQEAAAERFWVLTPLMPVSRVAVGILAVHVGWPFCFQPIGVILRFSVRWSPVFHTPFPPARPPAVLRDPLSYRREYEIRKLENSPLSR